MTLIEGHSAKGPFAYIPRHSVLICGRYTETREVFGDWQRSPQRAVSGWPISRLRPRDVPPPKGSALTCAPSAACTTAPSSARQCPDHRLSSSVRLHDGRRARDLNSYVPYFLFTAHNALSRGTPRQYLNEFGVGIAEWRVVSTLAMEPGITARQVCDMIALDKVAVSRSLHVLATRALAESAPGTK